MGNRQRIGIALAVVYWVWLVALYFYFPFGDPGYQYGGIGLILYTLPLSLVGQIIAGLVGWIAPDYIGEGVWFFVLVVVCGGVNGYVLMRLCGYRLGRVGIRIILSVGLLVATAVQATLGPRSRAAVNYHWPANVPKTAFLVPNWSGGWYQQCGYDDAAHTDHCRIWNFGGLVLYDEEFVPYDAGPPVPAAQLKITDRISGPDRITLENGRTLIPKSREADMRRFIDSLYGSPARHH